MWLRRRIVNNGRMLENLDAPILLQVSKMPLYVLGEMGHLLQITLTDYRSRIPRSSYYDKNYRQSAALIRARRPFLVRNIVTGTAIFAFAISVCKSRSHDRDICVPYRDC